MHHSFRRIFLVAFLGVTTTATSLPAAAGPSEVQLYLMRKAVEDKREKARIAAQDKQKLEECAKQKEDTPQNTEKTEG